MTNRRIFLETTLALAALPKLHAENDPFAALPASAWANARQNGLCMLRRNVPATFSRETTIVTAGELGRRITVHGQVLAPDGRTPAPGVIVYAYNTDAEGYYGENRTEYPPRLYGWMQTDQDGRFTLHTIFPGRYPHMNVLPHIHFSLWGAGYPLQWVDELTFQDDRAARRGECAFTTRVTNTCNFR
jgi:protocatechuate 3,4-dioxygenase beta subunit